MTYRPRRTAPIEAFRMVKEVYRNTLAWPAWLRERRAFMESFKGEHTQDEWMLRLVQHTRSGQQRQVVNVGDYIALINNQLQAFESRAFESQFEKIEKSPQ